MVRKRLIIAILAIAGLASCANEDLQDEQRVYFSNYIRMDVDNVLIGFGDTCVCFTDTFNVDKTRLASVAFGSAETYEDADAFLETQILGINGEKIFVGSEGIPFKIDKGRYIFKIYVHLFSKKSWVLNFNEFFITHN